MSENNLWAMFWILFFTYFFISAYGDYRINELKIESDAKIKKMENGSRQKLSDSMSSMLELLQQIKKDKN